MKRVSMKFMKREDPWTSTVDDATRQLLLQYMREGESVISSPQIMKDRLKPEVGAYGAFTLFSDAAWVWSSENMYYLEQYGLFSDDAFIQHVQESGGHVADHPPIDAAAVRSLLGMPPQPGA